MGAGGEKVTPLHFVWYNFLNKVSFLFLRTWILQQKSRKLLKIFCKIQVLAEEKQWDVVSETREYKARG